MSDENPDVFIFVRHHPDATIDHFGLIPGFLDYNDPRPAKEQFNERYCGGWNPNPKFELRKGMQLKYLGDPALKPITSLLFRDEIIVLYNSAIVAIIQKDGSFEVCRMD